MIKSRIAEIVFDVEKYIEIIELNRFNNMFFVVAAVGIIEGNIQVSKEDNRITLLDIYNVNCKNSDYIFLSLYNLIKSNSDLYNYIVKYFNLWHGREFKEFTYDNYHKNELKNNFNQLISLIYDELKYAIKNKDYETISIYESFLYNIIEEFK
ncbi:hypothetical protein HZF24_13510 [Sedimentibacter hydroxybenzoicus DSM 7310]|uniref:Uncharacterized protein n=1 Tax=Sedimentibacter hydroxybenzoicus DSM 7310 TaxID=1123245 RepID=A0A974GXK5_SEDHY|nr:hypothetical protein [Sedimentibacter hydroxybenzoicus]NYB75160.1 hypothetical protein [Sedimentibacter hydroxybenzoicus DSM 7310]